jgi:trans-aconitate 2-methyltransferase
MAWDPAEYLKFGDERLRPCLDLLARIGGLPAGPVYDLGCGTGELAAIMAQRWPDRTVHGVDSSREMLGRAAALGAPITWVEADLRLWRAPVPASLLFSNAVYQWLDGHEALFPALLAGLAPGGVLAVQMPRNFAAPSHVLMREVALAGPWRDKLAPLLRPDPVGAPDLYYDLLAPRAAAVDLWETEYLHVLPGSAGGPSPVLTWVRGTALRPLLAALDAAEAQAFSERYDSALRRAYPGRGDGSVLFPFRRIFMIART